MMVRRSPAKVGVRVKSLSLENFTVFSSAQIRFSPSLNIIIGENGTGKTHVLKAVYSALEVISQEFRKPSTAAPTKALLQVRLAEKLTNVFRSESLGRLARRQPGRQRCDVEIEFSDSRFNTKFGFATNSKTEVGFSGLPEQWLASYPVYIPTRELLTIYPNFVSIYDAHFLEFEETWRDTCLLLGLPIQKGPKEQRINQLLAPLEQAMGGSIEFDKSGRFYLRTSLGRVEMPLVAEGMRKLAMVGRLIATGALLDNGYLFWDEPEANLNPRLIKKIAATILNLSANGIQVFVATHSLFLLREIDILLKEDIYKSLRPKFFSLNARASGVVIEQGGSLSEIESIVSLDEEIEQSDRFVALVD